jgi:hypothetical protein
MPLDSTTLERYYDSIEVKERDGLFFIEFSRSASTAALTEADHSFHSRLRRAIFYVNACRATMDAVDRKRYLVRLNEIAAAPRPECGLRQLGSYEKDFEFELKKYRDRYAHRAALAWGVFLVASLAGTAALLLGNVASWAPAALTENNIVDGLFLGPLDLYATMTYVFIWVWGTVGLAIGEMFAARYDSLDPHYESFFSEARFRFDPAQRIMFVTLTWTIFIFLLAHGWLDMTVGGLTLSSVEENPWSAVVLGIMTSIGFQGLIGAIIERLSRKENRPA